MGLPPQTPPEGVSPQTPFFASRRFKAALAESGHASLPDSCSIALRAFFDFRRGLPWGCRPKPRLRGIPPQTPFFASRRFKAALAESGHASLPDSCPIALRAFGDFRKGLSWGCCPIPRLRGYPLRLPSSLRGGLKKCFKENSHQMMQPFLMMIQA